MSFVRYSEEFLEKLSVPKPLPEGVGVLMPLNDPDVAHYTRSFYRKYYSDDKARILLFGINPGRFGAGVTGVPFTDPIRLEEVCGIENDLEQKPELSSVFIYDMIKSFGGADRFYSKFLFTAVSPLGFVRDGKNMNYYDDRNLKKALEQFVVESIEKQIRMGADHKVAYSLGKSDNYKYLSDLNEKRGFFEDIIPLPHPRWVMQYRRKRKDEFLELYVRTLDTQTRDFDAP